MTSPAPAMQIWQHPVNMSDNPQSLTLLGFAVLPAILDRPGCEQAALQLRQAPRNRAGFRRLLQQPWCAELALSIQRNPALALALPSKAVAVQCTVFTKSAASNWLVPLHQDRSIPVRARVTSPHLTGWSEKEGGLFVQPTADVLAQLTAVRIHLDPSQASNGALRVVPGSHLHGVLTQEQRDQLRQTHGERTVPVPQGGALVMKPLILHASSKSESPDFRRVLHFLFGPRELPHGLQWRDAV